MDFATMSGPTFLVGLLGGFSDFLELVGSTSGDDHVGTGAGEEDGCWRSERKKVSVHYQATVTF